MIPASDPLDYDAVPDSTLWTDADGAFEVRSSAFQGLRIKDGFTGSFHELTHNKDTSGVTDYRLGNHLRRFRDGTHTPGDDYITFEFPGGTASYDLVSDNITISLAGETPWVSSGTYSFDWWFSRVGNTFEFRTAGVNYDDAIIRYTATSAAIGSNTNSFKVGGGGNLPMDGLYGFMLYDGLGNAMYM